MIRLIILLLSVYSGAAYSGSAEHSLLCKEPGQSSDAARLTLSFEEEIFFLTTLIADVGQIMSLDKRKERKMSRSYFLIRRVTIWA